MATVTERARGVFPAGSLGEYDLPPELTVVPARGQDAPAWDTEGRPFVDFTMGCGSVLPGHAHPAVAEGARRPATLGAHFADVSALALELGS